MTERLPPTSEAGRSRQPVEQAAPGHFSWWSWRPGMAPISAVLSGLPLLLLACALITTGIYTLAAGIAAGPSAPAHLSGEASTHAGSFYSLPGSIILFLLGALILPYALFLTFGGWHDLRGQQQAISGRILALRTTAKNVIRQGRPARPGVTAGIARAWYGMALQPLEPLESTGPAGRRRVMIFRLSEERYRDLREGEFVQVVYTPHLHHVRSLRRVERV